MSTRNKWSIGVSASVILLFCSSFVFFYSRSQRQHANSLPLNTKSAFGKELPAVHLTDGSGQSVDDRILHQGKVVIVFVSADCAACHLESDFLRTIVGRRSDVTFYGIVAFGKRTDSKDAEDRFPFKLLYDEGFFLAPKLGISRVPIKLYLENGIITKAWGGATVEESPRADFVKWLDSV